MKTVRMIGLALFAILLCVNFTSCSSNDDVEPDAPQKPKEYVVSLGFTGEISVSESPLSRASGNDLYGIQVYSCPNVDGATTYTKYAYGLFDDTSLMKIKLFEGYKYMFRATMIVDGKDKIDRYSGKDGENYEEPFVDAKAGYTTKSNDFNYSTEEALVGFNCGITSSSTSLKIGGTYTRPNTDRYYGEISDYVPMKNGNLTIDMKRVVLGAKFIADTFTEGTLNIAMEGAPSKTITYIETNDEIYSQDIYTLSNLLKAYTIEDYSETIPTTITWTKADGVVVPLGTHDITFKRNVLTTVTIKVADVTTENGIGFELETTEMGAEDITIENGEIVDTNVTPETGQ